MFILRTLAFQPLANQNALLLAPPSPSAPLPLPEDILDLWTEGDELTSDEFLAVASHRSQEEDMRQAKPSNFNGGLVLYEVKKLRG